MFSGEESLHLKVTTNFLDIFFLEKAGSIPWTSGGLTLASSRSYWEESRGPGLSKAGGSKSVGHSLNVTSSMHRSNASP